MYVSHCAAVFWFRHAAVQKNVGAPRSSVIWMASNVVSFVSSQWIFPQRTSASSRATALWCGRTGVFSPSNTSISSQSRWICIDISSAVFIQLRLGSHAGARPSSCSGALRKWNTSLLEKSVCTGLLRPRRIRGTVPAPE